MRRKCRSRAAPQAVVFPAASTLRDEMAVSGQRLPAASGHFPMAAHRCRCRSSAHPPAGGVTDGVLPGRQRELIALVASVLGVGATRTTFTLDDSLAEQARRLGVNISAAARDGVAAAVRAALVQADRAAYRNKPEKVDEFWAEAESWGDE